jgi:hypothetical protein
MESPQEEQLSSSPPASPITSSNSVDIAPSSYLTVPITVPSGPCLLLPGPGSFGKNFIDLLLLPEDKSPADLIPLILGPAQEQTPTPSSTPPATPPQSVPLSDRVYMSVYSSSSADTDLSEFSNPPARRYRVPDPPKMSRKISAVCTFRPQTDASRGVPC